MASKPIAVLISDVHYNLQTLELADAAMRQAILRANSLNVPLIVAGDLHDTKANLRAECTNRLIETIQLCNTRPQILRGNHCSLNEKSRESSLRFLKPYAWIFEQGYSHSSAGYLIPYEHDLSVLRHTLSSIPKGATVIMHQGIEGSHSGEYIQDKTALSPNDVAGLRIISGHYHRRQDIQLPDGGLWSYIGNPYTLGFGEANDPEKGFQVLYDDGSLEFVPTNLRKHIVIDIKIGQEATPVSISPEDLVLVRVTASKEYLIQVTKESTRREILIRTGQTLPENYRLDLIPLETDTHESDIKSDINQRDLLDTMIDSLTNTSIQKKQGLKDLWKSFQPK